MKNVKEVKIEVKGKEWEEALDKAFNKKKKDIKVDGFRKGNCPKNIYIKKVGIEALFQDACDIAMQDAYKKVLEDNDLEIVCEPGVNLDAIDKDHAAFTFTLIGKPEVKLGKYKNLGIKRDKVTVTAEEVNHEIEHLMSHMAEIVIKENGSVAKGDTAVIDFEGKVDGKVIDGGVGKDYPLEIGSNTFIPGFEDGVIGMKVNETKDLELKFPEQYTEELKGKDVTFKVTVKEIKEKVNPEMNKEFFEDLGIDGVTDEKSLKDHIKKDIKANKERQAEDKYIDELLRTATENMKVDINNEIIESEVDRMINDYRHELSHQGITFEQYLSMTGSKMEDVKSMMKPQAIARIKTRYLLEEVVKEEKIKVTDSEIDKEIKNISAQYQMKEEEFIAAIGGKEMIKYDVEMKKALEIIKENKKEA